MAVAGVVALVPGCGVPSSGSAHPVPSDEVPYGLLDGPRTPTPTSSPAPRVEHLPGVPTVFYLRREFLVGVVVPRPPANARTALAQAVSSLSSGPTGEQRAQGLDTALPPALHLVVAGIAGTQVTIDLQGQDAATVGAQGPLAVGQVVLTATSVPGVDTVVLTRQGEPMQAQLSDGSLTDRPLSREDYEALLAPR
jgi:spore germination protein GerM